MLNKKNRKMCGKVIKVYPKKHQMMIAMEESGEFVQAISKYLRYGDMEPVLEEFADMEVMMQQVRKLLGIKKKEIDKRAKQKLIRTLKGKVVIHGRN